MFNDLPLLYDFWFAARLYAPQVPVDFIDTDLIQTPKCYVTTLEENYSLKKLELEEILNFQATIIDYSILRYLTSSAALSLLWARFYWLCNVAKKLIVFS